MISLELINLFNTLSTSSLVKGERTYKALADFENTLNLVQNHPIDVKNTVRAMYKLDADKMYQIMCKKAPALILYTEGNRIVSYFNLENITIKWFPSGFRVEIKK